jgi:adenylate cyclase
MAETGGGWIGGSQRIQRLSCASCRLGPQRGIERQPSVADAQDVASGIMGAVSKKVDEMLTFWTSITCAAMAFIAALPVLLIVIQLWTFHLAAKEAASAHMDAASAKTLGRLQDEISEIASLVRVLSTGSGIADSDDRPEAGRAIPLFKAALLEVPQMDSIYVSHDNGVWLQVRPLNDLSEEQRSRIRAPAGTAFGINVSRCTPEGDLLTRRIVEDQQGNELDQLDLWKYGYDPRRRRWYVNTIKSDATVVSSPYLAYSIGAPVITVSAPLRGRVRGVIAADLELDDFSDFVFRCKEIGSVAAKDMTSETVVYELTGALP